MCRSLFHRHAACDGVVSGEADSGYKYFLFPLSEKVYLVELQALSISVKVQVQARVELCDEGLFIKQILFLFHLSQQKGVPGRALTLNSVSKGI